MRVFLSYSSDDKELAREIAATLRADGLDVWDDSTEIFPGDNWAAKIGEGLRTSTAMVVLLSHQSLRSDFVKHEISYALGDPGYKKKLIPVLIGSLDVADEEEIPWILRHMQVIRVTDDNREESKRLIAATLQSAA